MYADVKRTIFGRKLRERQFLYLTLFNLYSIMKYFWILMLFNFLNGVRAQNDTLSIHQVYSSFSNQEKAEWTAFENNWNFIEYTKLKKHHKIKSLNCKNCESFYADIYLEINNSGLLIVTAFAKGKICGLPISNVSLIKDFEASLKAKTFGYLKNKKFIARWGNILKC